MGDNGGSTDTQVVGNFLVRQSAYNEYEHFDLAMTESVGVGIGSGSRYGLPHTLGQMSSVSMRMLLQLQQCTHHIVFVLVDVQRMEVGGLRGAGCPVGKHNGFFFPFHKEGAVLHKGLG